MYVYDTKRKGLIMDRNDTYGLNKNESWLYYMARTIAQETNKNNITKQIVSEAIQEAIECGTNRRITSDYNKKLVQTRLYNWFAV